MNELKDLICNFNKGEYIFKQGDEGDCLYVVQEGAIIIKKEICGKNKDMDIVKKGQFFGEISVIMEQPRTASAYVLEDCKLLKISKDNLELIFSKRSDIARQLFHGLSERLIRANKQIELLLTEDPTKRILGGLVIYCSMYLSTRVGNTLKLDLTPEEFAFEMGIDPLKVQEVMKDLEKEKITVLEDGKIKIKDLKKLKTYFGYYKRI